ncbi:mandelate racemase/muconate lactonizing enzyme family protein [Halorarum halophilum]|uniref:Mandelate racemase/muconate lactonizing enzyme family protein n=1 Tax=Halorarum halophilum TaxID=2743090 RepID=A0A7D5GN11_9EURY|nr:mandelate racemase/muconate lactonizing enzyme family protein [Halobaculum halophilum]QLG28964.1 mandelate racemase/muconate lactonizing enzyme family protein [Halobaculum halophilum]
MVQDDEPDYRVAQGGGVPWRDLARTETHRPSERDIEITDIKTMAIAGNFTWGIVKVETDAGVYGLGETFRAEAALDMAGRMGIDLEGENPLDTHRMRELLEQRYTGTGRIGQAAFTAIETACYDIKGKLLDVPVYELLGGKYRDEIKIYCDTHAGESLGEATAHNPKDVYTPESYAQEARAVVDEGFDALKFDLDVPTHAGYDDANRRMDNEALEHKVSLVEAVRDEIGYDIDLGMDLHWNFTVETAIRLGKKLEQFDLAWLEDPVPPEKWDAQKRVTESVDIPILTGENLVTVDQFNKTARMGMMDIAAPDVNKCGGLGEYVDIATVCDLYGIPIASHNISSPLGTVAGAHVSAAIPNFIAMEWHSRDVPWWNDMVARTGESGPILEEGYINVPEGPGLGVELNRDLCEQYLTDGSELIV